MRMITIFGFLGLIIAAICGIYAQDISYFLNEQFPFIELSTAITVITLLSIGLYILIPILFSITKKVKKETFYRLLVVSGLVGVLISIRSLFVWAMWMM